MFETELRLYAFVQGYCQMTFADIEAGELAHRHFPGSNSPGWILGHLAIATDLSMALLGGDGSCPADWHTKFGQGSTPAEALDAYPSKAELLDAYVGGHERVAAALKGGSHEHLEEPHGIEPLNQTPLETKRDFLTYLMTSHESGHIGQLSTWRRQMGRPALF